jgi:hypothetical protein
MEQIHAARSEAFYLLITIREVDPFEGENLTSVILVRPSFRQCLVNYFNKHSLWN